MKGKSQANAESVADPFTFNHSVHLILQGKGGCGKSLIAAVKAQYCQARGYTPINGDTDPVNSTFAQIKGLNAQRILITEGGAVVQRKFDPLFEQIVALDRVAVIDNGASTFLPLIKYIKSNEILNLLQASGKRVYIHCVMVGGQAKDDTAQGLLSLLDLVKQSGSNAKIVVWENEFWGIPEFEGKALAEMPWIQDNADVIQGIVKIVDRNSDAFTTDIRLMTERHMTLCDVMNSDEFGMFAKSRIQRVFTDLFLELDRVYGVKAEDK